LTGAGAGAFLKLGNLGLGFGAEKNDESDLASLTAVAEATDFALSLVSLTPMAFVVVVVFPIACFFNGGSGFTGGSLGLRFFDFESIKYRDVS
jgi:hypothetical protein